MIVWVLAGVLVAIAAGLGFLLGGIRAAVGLVGTIVAAFMSTLVGGWVAGVVPLIGFKNPIWQFYLPPVLGFILVSLVFWGVGVAIHYFVERRFRNNTDEYTFARWFRLNRRTGAAVGGVLGTVWLVLLAVVAYVPGYLSTQLADSDEDSFALRTANGLTHGMEDTGLLRIVERYRPGRDAHYLASDILGIVYNNPSVHSRLASYPPFLGLAEKPEIAELARDPEINTLIQSRAGLTQVLQHPRIQAVSDNHELVNELLALNFQDLHQYLLTGVSEVYKDEHILGRWRLNVRRSIAEMKTVSTEKLPPVEFNLLRKALNVYLDDMIIGFTTDNRALLKVKAKDEQKLLQTVGRASGPTGGGGAGGGAGGGGGGGEGGGEGSPLTPQGIASRAIPQPSESDAAQQDLLRSRYGPTGGRGGSAQNRAVPLATTTPSMPVMRSAPKAPSTSTLAPLMTSADGSWTKAGDQYRMSFSGNGKELVMTVRVQENQLVATVDGRTLVFDRI